MMNVNMSDDSFYDEPFGTRELSKGHSTFHKVTCLFAET